MEIEIEPGMRDGQEYPFVAEGNIQPVCLLAFICVASVLSILFFIPVAFAVFPSDNHSSRELTDIESN